MEFSEVVKLRQSCRSYDPQKMVKKEDIDSIIKEALYSPSACNSQPYSIIAVNSKELSPKVAKCTQKYGGNKFTTECPAFLVIVEEKANLLARVGAIVEKRRFTDNDIGILVGHICLGATNKGLSTCIMGLFDDDKIKELLEIKKDKKVSLIIAIGYAKEDYPLREKKRKLEEEVYKYIGE